MNKTIVNPQKRITFFKERDYLGICLYRFVGVFELDTEQSKKENKLVWKRIADRYDL